jgi:N-acetylglucosamine-6-phosphate deacetylase
MPPEKKLTALTNALIFTGEERISGRALLLQEDKVLDIVKNEAVPIEAIKQSLSGLLLVPGFVDLQVNGGGNVLLNNDPTKDGVLKIAAAHHRHGTTRLLPTCITDTPEIMHSALAAVREAEKEDSGILGIHFEGPHITRFNIHAESLARPIEPEDFAFYQPQDGEVMIITLSPDCVTPEQVKKLVAQGVLVSIGHTEAKPETILPILAAGARGFTHLFNAMGGLSGRDPGPLGTALDDRNSWCGLILDAKHVLPPLVRLALRAKPRGKIFIVSDAAAPAGAEIKEPFIMGGMQIHITDGKCLDNRGVIAGCANTLRENVIAGIKEVGIEPDEAFRMASTYPASFIGREKSLGRLLPGFKADIVALNDAYDAKQVWLDGNLIG